MSDHMLRLGLGDGSNAPLHLLCIGAHSDDIEIGCGGTILRLLAERPGSRVTWVVMAAPDERADEAHASALDFTADAADRDVVVHQFKQSYFPSCVGDLKDVFETLKLDHDPDVVFSHRRSDRHQDHRTLGELTWNTFRSHAIFEYEIPKYEGDLGLPNLYVPLTETTASRKVDLLMRHFGSQHGRAWFREQTFLGLMALRSVECNAPEGFAEAFHADKMVV